MWIIGVHAVLAVATYFMVAMLVGASRSSRAHPVFSSPIFIPSVWLFFGAPALVCGWFLQRGGHVDSALITFCVAGFLGFLKAKNVPPEQIDAKASACVTQLVAELRRDGMIAGLYSTALGIAPGPNINTINTSAAWDELVGFGGFCLSICSTQYIRAPNARASFVGRLEQHLRLKLTSPASFTAFDSYNNAVCQPPPGYNPMSTMRDPAASSNQGLRQTLLQQDMFIQYKFKLSVFADRLLLTIQQSVSGSTVLGPPGGTTDQRAAANLSRLKPYGRKIAEMAADITKSVLVNFPA